jgi:tetratricopeptide (TPR) repeat protein
LKIAAARVLIDLGRHEEAEPLLRASMALYVAEVADFPTFGANHHHLANAKLELGRLLAETARVEEGIRLCRESLDAYDRAIELEHSRPNTWDRLLENCRAVGMILERAGSLASAEEVYRRGVRYADRFEREARDRGDSGWFDQILEWRCRNRWRLADLLRRKGATAEADELVQQVDTLVRDHLALRKAKLGPDHPDAMRSLNNLASCYSARGRHADALRLREEVLRVYRDAPQRHADKRPEAKVLNNLAWLLATCPDPELRDPGRAVGLAKEAVELAPTAPEYHNTLGVARYRAGDWRGAIEALTKSEELAPDRNLGTNALFLAMAHRQLGDEPRALRWFDEADRWMQKTARTDAELIRFRAEAEQLLRVEGRAQTETKDGPR